MTIPNLFLQLGWMSIVFPAIGVVVSHLFRKRPWIVFVWLPNVLLLVYTSLWAIAKMAAFGNIRGPDAIGVGFAMLVLGGVLCASLVGLSLCFLVRPTKEAWKLATALPATALCVGLSVLVYSPHGAHLSGRISRLSFVVSDVEGTPLPGIRVNVVVYEGGLGAGGSKQTTGIDGQFAVQLREAQSARVELRPPIAASDMLSARPAFWDLNIQMPRKGDSEIVIRHSWHRSLGGHTFNESFTERVPDANELDLRVILPTLSGLGGVLFKEKLHAAIVKDYDCRSIEAVEHLPWLIETYRNNPGSSAGVAQGISQIAAILSELDRACGRLEAVAANPRQHNKNYLDGEFSYEAASLTSWAGVSGIDRESALKQTRAVIVERAKILAEFAIAEAPSHGSLVGAFGELRRLGLPHLTSFFEMLRKNPPRKEQTCQSWGHSLWMVVAGEDKLEKLRPLFEMRDPACNLIACEAMGNQINSVGPEILKSMKEVCDAAPESEVRRRLLWRIKWIEEDLARVAVLREKAKKP